MLLLLLTEPRVYVHYILTLTQQGSFKSNIGYISQHAQMPTSKYAIIAAVQRSHQWHLVKSGLFLKVNFSAR